MRPFTLLGTANRPVSGFTLLEVIICAAMLVIVATAVSLALVSSMRQTRISDEYRAAALEARRQIERLPPGMTGAESMHGSTFAVKLNSGAHDILLQGINGADAGEIIAITREDANPANYGRDLRAPIGPDGVSLAPVPMDLTGDNVLASGNVDAQRVKVIVGAVVRWVSHGGLEQRYELWTVR